MLAQWAKVYFSIKLSFNKGIIHNDIVLFNLLADRGELAAVIDFSDMAYSPYIQNIAVSLAQVIFTYNWQPNQAKIFFDGYSKYRLISEKEFDFLYDLILVRYAIIIIEFNHLNVRFGADHQRSESVKDNYAFMKKFMKINIHCVNFYW